MIQQCLVSVVTPVYNGEAFLTQAIESVISQTYSQWELLLVDDGSTDGSLEIMREYEREDRRISALVNENNLGISASRNRAIEASQGEWIAFLDCDDQWESSKLEKQLQATKELNASFIFTGASYIDKKGIPYKGILKVPSQLTFKRLRAHNIIICSSVLAKKEYFERFKILRRDVLDDFTLWLMILRSGVTARGINEPLLIYRIHREAVSRNKWRMLKQTYGAFRYIDLTPSLAAYFTSRHAMAATIKHFGIRTGRGRGRI